MSPSYIEVSLHLGVGVKGLQGVFECYLVGIYYHEMQMDTHSNLVIIKALKVKNDIYVQTTTFARPYQFT